MLGGDRRKIVQDRDRAVFLGDKEIIAVLEARPGKAAFENKTSK